MGVALRQNAVSAVIPSPTDGWPVVQADQASPSMGPVQGDQEKGIPRRHLHDAVQADIDVPSREGDQNEVRRHVRSVPRRSRPAAPWAASAFRCNAPDRALVRAAKRSRRSRWRASVRRETLLGMILDNCMTGIALGLNTLTTTLMLRRPSVEAQLIARATRWEAAAPVTRQALRSALMPTINSMSATGLVSLPGMMTGQILSGVPPVEAVKYQILVMFLIAGGTGFGAVAAVLGGGRSKAVSQARTEPSARGQ